MTARPLQLTASILSADLANLQAEVDSVAPHADGLQIDVMDGHFVPNLSFGAMTVKCLKTNLLLDVHLMVTNPQDRIAEFLSIPVQHITFHAEAVADPSDRRDLIRAIRNGGATAGIALNPKTPLAAIDDVVDDVDLVLLMSVEPGFGGQSFIDATLDKIRALRAAHPGLTIQVDGGVNAETAAACIEAGADNLVIGSALFRTTDRAGLLRRIRDAAS